MVERTAETTVTTAAEANVETTSKTTVANSQQLNPLELATNAEKLTHVTLYSAPLVIPVTGPLLIDGAIAVSGSRVIHVGTREWVLKVLREQLSSSAHIEERRWKGVITPGLVNAHTHLQYTNMREVGEGHYKNFRGWADGFNVVYEQLQHQPDSIWRDSAFDGARQLVENGVTAAADIVTDPEAVGALASQGLHGIAYWEVMNWDNQDWQTAGVPALMEQIGAMRQQRIPSIGISPHAPYTLASEPFVELPDIARQLNMRLHIHLAETPMEAGGDGTTLTTYSAATWNNRDWESYKALKNAGMDASAIQFLDQLGSLGPDVHIAHGVWANAEDRRILRQRGVGVALCPRSNRITVTEKDAPLREYLEEGNLLSVGTDSLSSSPSLDVLDDVSMLWDLARQQGYDRPDLAHRLIRMMTLGGAAVMGLHVGPGRLGQINAGAPADLAFFDIPVETQSPADVEHTLEVLVRQGAGTNRATVINGRLAYNRNAFDAPTEPVPSDPTT